MIETSAAEGPPLEPTGLPFTPGRADPDLVTLFRGWAYLSFPPRGDIPGGRLQGFFAAGACLVDRYRILVNGRAPRCSFGAQSTSDRWGGVFVVPGSSVEGDLPAQSIPVGALELTVLRNVAECWTESLTLRNNSCRARSAELVLEWNCPIEDAQPQESKKHVPKRAKPGLVPDVSWKEGQPRLRYRRVFGPRRRAPTEEFGPLLGPEAPRNGDVIERGLEIRISQSSTGRAKARVAGRIRTKLAFRPRLPPQGEWTLLLEFSPSVDGRSLPRPAPRPDGFGGETRIRTGNETLNQILSRAVEDLGSLALPELGSEETAARAPAGLIAGIPRYVGIFGRDLLTTAWQSSLLSLKYLEEAIARAALYRGVRRDDWRDEEPDRILHERRANPNSCLGRSNREIYYGDVASTPFWVVSLASAYHWNGSREFLDRHAGTLEGCCRWILRRLREGGGFVYYDPRSPQANRHQGWKDSGDAIVDGRGRVQAPPLAVAEVQGYCFLALLLASEMTLVRREVDRARELYREAVALRRRFNRAFWMPREQFFAMALGPGGKQVDGIGSNAGHCLGCGIVERAKAPFVAKRLLSEELFSGWGIRTLSRQNPAYDPFSYHRGSVWPVENGTISAGLRLCGFDREAGRVIGAQLCAASRFPAMRLPEVMSGHPRTPAIPVPGLYPEANLLQSWSVSTILFFVWVLLGLRPLAPLRTLLVKPYLPEWLPWVRLTGLRIGNATVDITFWRTGAGRTRWKVLEKRGRLFVLEQPLELDPAATLGRRFRDLARSLT